MATDDDQFDEGMPAVDYATAVTTLPSLETLTTKIVCSYVASNSLPPDQLPGLIESVHRALAELEDDRLPAAADNGHESWYGQPAVAVEHSVSENTIICLNCGKAGRSMREHIRVAHGMTAEEYRSMWGLSYDYPLVAPSTSAKMRDRRFRVMEQQAAAERNGHDIDAEAEA